MFDHILHEEIVESIDSIELVTDFGGKFISDNSVYLGGFDKNRQELLLIEDLLISGVGASKQSAEYGAYIMRELRIFDTLKVHQSTNITTKDFKDIRYGGFLTVSQSGAGDSLMDAMTLAHQNHLTCFNIVNVEDSPITQHLDKLIKMEEEEARE